MLRRIGSLVTMALMLMITAPAAAKTTLPEILGTWVSTNTREVITTEYTETGLNYVRIGDSEARRALFWYDETSGLLYHSTVPDGALIVSGVQVNGDELRLIGYRGMGQLIFRKERPSF